MPLEERKICRRCCGDHSTFTAESTSSDVDSVFSMWGSDFMLHSLTGSKYWLLLLYVDAYIRMSHSLRSQTALELNVLALSVSLNVFRY